jgi:hypothetical protein
MAEATKSSDISVTCVPSYVTPSLNKNRTGEFE